MARVTMSNGPNDRGVLVTLQLRSSGVVCSVVDWLLACSHLGMVCPIDNQMEDGSWLLHYRGNDSQWITLHTKGLVLVLLDKWMKR